MQIVQYKALRTLLKALPEGVVRDGSFGRNINAKNDFFCAEQEVRRERRECAGE